jgi:hypothetical protein
MNKVLYALDDIQQFPTTSLFIYVNSYRYGGFHVCHNLVFFAPKDETRCLI